MGKNKSACDLTSGLKQSSTTFHAAIYLQQFVKQLQNRD